MDEFLAAAIEEAKLGSAAGGIAIGSVLVAGGRIIGRGHNQDGRLAAIDCAIQ